MGELLIRRREMILPGASSTVHGTWGDLYRCITEGTYNVEYELGEVLPLDLGAEGNVGAQIVAFNADAKADDSGNAAITFITQSVLNTSERFNPARTPDAAPYDEGTGLIGGWEKSERRAYVQNTIAPLFPAEVSSRIVAVKKYSRGVDINGSAVNNQLTVDRFWVPSQREVLNAGETSGPTYTAYFSSNTIRKKTKVGSSSAQMWALRTAYGTTKICRVFTSGALDSAAPTTSNLLAIGFCID